MSAKPKLSEVVYHFRNAREIRCVKTGMVLDVSLGMEIIFKNGAYTIANGMVALWESGAYADITKKKPNAKCKCETCNCADKKTTVKRNPKK